MTDGTPPTAAGTVATTDRHAAPAAGRRLSRPVLVTYGLAQLVLLFWWAVYHPGLFSPDSLSYITQSTTGTWNTHHPITYTGLVWLSLQIFGGVGALTGLQTVAMAVGLAYAVGGLRRVGVPGWLAAGAAVVTVALPPVGGFVVAVWKDVPFVICHVFLLGTLARVVARHRAGLRPVLPAGLLVAAAVAMTLICLFRQNGFIVVAIVAVACALLLRPAGRLLITTVAAATAALLTNWALLPALGVRDSGSLVAYEALFADISVAYAADPAAFPPEHTEVMARVAPLSHWRDAADCYHSDSLTYAEPFDRRTASVHSGALVDVWLATLARAPGTVVGARICRSSIGWSPLPAGTISRNPPEWSLRAWVERDRDFQKSPYAHVARMRPLDERVHRIGAELTGLANRPGLEWLMWRGATWTYLAYAAVGFAAWRRREPALLALAALSAGNQLSVLIVNNVQAARYMAAPYVLGVLLLPLLAVRRSPAATTAAPSDAAAPPAATGGPTVEAGGGDRDGADTALPRQRGDHGGPAAQARLDERG
ncbi:hypothetical protein [Polymorphospora rubra]|uniref:Glycosyltransferase RgtA/B/C/D-like domain-containing protein n=1 Tax=Polymorphospora rubra TaxID=338584 RepID=A0A810N0C2_9ACTN|nr:hypothetical protein [Polymorphospora rubra]BCJ66846.1 hypothetical protein Prubr_38670 [Polymorphospora rubra]